MKNNFDAEQIANANFVLEDYDEKKYSHCKLIDLIKYFSGESQLCWNGPTGENKKLSKKKVSV